MSCVWMPLAPAQASLGLNSLWLVLLPLAGQLLVLAALLVVNPDPDATGVVGSGKRKAGQGRSGRPMFLSGYHIRYRYRGYSHPTYLISRLDDTERCSVTPPPSPSEDHHASPLLPSLRSCSGVSCVWMPLAPAQALLGLNSLWLVLLPLAGQLLVLASLLVVNPDPDATGVVGSGKRKAGQGRSGRPPH
ncbi:hypothetical protein EDB92DRAFT_556139 [Lactarius akahatsu]|uniref:Uncharacterized protein n=1 Tax=Lactarius akahatsu TaxID=416441 RepID=A0AAD4L559_9AGAM|nr:hypothetical protein EDB92DRAFT_556139 [Lactarius akahatsu]